MGKYSLPVHDQCMVSKASWINDLKTSIWFGLYIYIYLGGVLVI